ncbi:MAG: hypothetical protein HC890_10670 [Chloroflexaceae bacterium]|nr:hypothetical protein [Chloroflexaceae bacterium]
MSRPLTQPPSSQALLHLAQQGNGQAIAALLNRRLYGEGIAATVSLQDERLHIILESSPVAPKALAVSLIRQELAQVKLAAIAITIEGRRNGQQLPRWRETLRCSRTTAAPADRSPPSLHQRARQGDRQAIAALLEQGLQHKGITVKVHKQGNRFEIQVESRQSLEPALVLTLIERELRQLQLSFLSSAVVAAYRAGNRLPAWQERLTPQPRTTAAIAQSSRRIPPIQRLGWER